MYDIGKTSSEALYDFTIRLDCAGCTWLDPESELAQAYNKLLDSCWGQLPQRIVLDFACDD